MRDPSDLRSDPIAWARARAAAVRVSMLRLDARAAQDPEHDTHRARWQRGECVPVCEVRRDATGALIPTSCSCHRLVATDFTDGQAKLIHEPCSCNGSVEKKNMHIRKDSYVADVLSAIEGASDHDLALVAEGLARILDEREKKLAARTGTRTDATTSAGDNPVERARKARDAAYASAHKATSWKAEG